ncbi:MAG TPA: cytochrome P450 [Acidimicrobiia bacterium]|nr:cytochrome P450 [Acidimicrobiia bacterium]
MIEGRTDRADFDPYSSAFQHDPYPVYARLREESPVFYDRDWELTFFTRHADVTGMLKDRRFGRDIRGVTGEIDPRLYARNYPDHLPTWNRYIRGSFIDLEPPRHTRLRRLVQWAFTRRSTETYRPRLEATAAAALETAIERGAMEAIAEYATPIPLVMIADLLGIPQEEQPQLVSWSHDIVRVFDQGCTAEEGARAEQAVSAFVEYIRQVLVDRRRNPGSDLISSLIAANHEGDRLDDDELIATCILTLNAGHEATVHAIGNGLLALASDPEQFELLKGDPVGLAAQATDEILRFDSPLQMFERWVLTDLDWSGTVLEHGTKVGLLFGSANHDEAVFVEPERLDLRRIDNPHVSFGAGVHYCVGAPLARVELEIAFASFASRIAKFELSGEPERVRSLVFRGMRSLPLALSPR